MRQTVTNMIGTLPPQFFAITVTTVSGYDFKALLAVISEMRRALIMDVHVISGADANFGRC